MSISRRSLAKLRVMLWEWAEALKHTSEEHGRPNSFGVAELAREYGLTRRDGYRLGTERLNDLWSYLGGHDGWGSCPTYKKGRFYV